MEQVSDYGCILISSALMIPGQGRTQDLELVGAQNAEGRVTAGGARPLLLQLGGGGGGGGGRGMGERCKLPHWGLWRSRSGGSRIVS